MTTHVQYRTTLQISLYQIELEEVFYSHNIQKSQTLITMTTTT